MGCILIGQASLAGAHRPGVRAPRCACLCSQAAQRELHFTPSQAKRLECMAVLHGHQGCVNRLAWNERGDKLISGSDDQLVRAGPLLRGEVLLALPWGLPRSTPAQPAAPRTPGTAADVSQAAQRLTHPSSCVKQPTTASAVARKPLATPARPRPTRAAPRDPSDLPPQVIVWNYPPSHGGTAGVPLAVETLHRAIIFGVQFLPQSNNAKLVSGGMDHTVQLHELPPADLGSAYTTTVRCVSCCVSLVPLRGGRFTV